MTTIQKADLVQAGRVFLGPTTSPEPTWPHHITTLAKKHMFHCAACKGILQSDPRNIRQIMDSAKKTADLSITKALQSKHASTSIMDPCLETSECVEITCDPSGYAQAHKTLHPDIVTIATHIIANFASFWNSPETASLVAEEDAIIDLDRKTKAQQYVRERGYEGAVRFVSEMIDDPHIGLGDQKEATAILQKLEAMPVVHSSH